MEACQWATALVAAQFLDTLQTRMLFHIPADQVDGELGILN